MTTPTPRGSIQIVNALGEVVPILDDGASITPSSKSTRYREYWTEEEDLTYVLRQVVTAPDGSRSTSEVPGDVHGNFGYELWLDALTNEAVLRVDYFTILPFVVDRGLAFAYEPKAVTVSGTLGRGAELRVDVELQAGFSEARGRPDLKYLRVTCR